MRAFSAVALHEVVERRFVLAAAGAAAVLPFLVPLLPGVPRDQAVLTRGITALILACSFGVGGAFLVGASVVGRELAERRLSFHFARPLPAPVVWGGKLAGGLALVLFAELIVYLPASAASGHFPGLWGSGADTRALWAILLAAVPLFLFAWIGSVALRSRSPWLVADLLLLVAVPTVVFLVTRRFLRYGGWADPVLVVATAVGVLVAAFLLATFAQVVVGRTDARRGHGAQSLALWGVLLAATAAGAAWAGRIVDPGVDRLVRAWAQPAGAGGDWVSVEGSARKDAWGSTSYLLNLRTGRSLLLPLAQMPTVSANGSRAAYVHASPFSKKEIGLETVDLKTGESVPVDLPDWPEGLDLTADGRRLAVVSGGVCRVVELPSLRLLGSARVPSSGWAYEPRFVSSDTVRMHPHRRRPRGAAGSNGARAAVEDPEAADFSVATRSVTPLARYAVSTFANPDQGPPGVDAGPIFFLVPSPDLSRVLALGIGTAYSVRLLDAASGRVLASSDGSKEAGRPTANFLADGRVVLTEPIPGGRRLALLTRDGVRLSELALPAGTSRVRIGFETGQGLLSVGLDRGSVADATEWSVADLEAGTLRPLAASGLQSAWWSETLRLPPPGSPATNVGRDADGRLVLFDPSTGARKPLTRGTPGGK